MEKEQVNEEDARKYAKDVGAIFKLTSACTASGIEELFKSIGRKILNPNYKDDDDSPNKPPSQQPPAQPKTNEKKDDKIKLGNNNSKEPGGKKKGGFC